MTRFDAATREDREALVADVVAAHRERESLFCTVEADGLPDGGGNGGNGGDGTAAGGDDETPEEDTNATADSEADDDARPAWVQFSEAEGQLNLDCTDEEYDRITTVLSEFSEFTVEDQSSPEDADGRNLRIQAWADDERIAELVDRIFVDGFGYDEDYRLWATEL